jgi:small nuclear ribonucleoprotein (snRNP)-like protein
MDSTVTVKCSGGRELVGVLRGYDDLVNLVLDDCEERIRGTDISTIPVDVQVTRESRQLSKSSSFVSHIPSLISLLLHVPIVGRPTHPSSNRPNETVRHRGGARDTSESRIASGRRRRDCESVRFARRGLIATTRTSGTGYLLQRLDLLISSAL